MKGISGRSMLEMLGVLAVYGVIAAGILGGVTYAYKAREQTEAVLKVMDIADQARSLFKWRLEYVTDEADIDMKYLICQKVIKTKNSVNCNSAASMRAISLAAAKPISPIGKSIDVKAERVITATNVSTSLGATCDPSDIGCGNVFTITLTGLKFSECLELLSADWGRNLFKIQGEYAQTTSKALPISKKYGKDFCASTGTDPITFSISLM